MNRKHIDRHVGGIEAGGTNSSRGWSRALTKSANRTTGKSSPPGTTPADLSPGSSTGFSGNRSNSRWRPSASRRSVRSTWCVARPPTAISHRRPNQGGRIPTWSGRFKWLWAVSRSGSIPNQWRGPGRILLGPSGRLRRLRLYHDWNRHRRRRHGRRPALAWARSPRDRTYRHFRHRRRYLSRRMQIPRRLLGGPLFGRGHAPADRPVGRGSPPGHTAWAYETQYIGYAIANIVCTLSPRRVIVGGSVSKGGQMGEEAFFGPSGGRFKPCSTATWSRLLARRRHR